MDFYFILILKWLYKIVLKLISTKLDTPYMEINKSLEQYLLFVMFQVVTYILFLKIIILNNYF
jgi:hypothetical protein